LSGLVDDCCCSVSDTQHVNDNYIARALDVLVKKQFFRFFKVNLDKECPFWAVEKTCGTNGGCDICHCNADEIPVSWRQTASDAVTRGGVDYWKDDDGDMWLSPEEGSTSYVDLTKNGCCFCPPPPLFTVAVALTPCHLCSEKNTGYVGPQVRIPYRFLPSRANHLHHAAALGDTGLGRYLPRKLLPRQHHVIPTDRLPPTIFILRMLNRLQGVMRSVCSSVS
jgi:hypothetical protein